VWIIHRRAGGGMNGNNKTKPRYMAWRGCVVTDNNVFYFEFMEVFVL
jgi:hypothetical protein